MKPKSPMVTGWAASAGCGAAVYLTPTGVEAYAAVRVQVYHGAGQCRIEVITATETIQTRPTRCARVPHRVTP